MEETFMLDNKEDQLLSDEALDEVSGGGLKGYDYYYVKPGDTFWKIAVTHNISMEDLGRLNNIYPPYYIRIHQQLIVPKVKY